MPATNGNYSAFYVAEPFVESALGSHATKDFVYYNLLRSWKGKDSSFPFVDSHDQTYNVRDNSDWESTLKPRLRERLRKSENIVLFLSERTVSSRALRDEIEYGIITLGLPVIIVYPDYDSKESLLSNGSLKQEVKNLWNKLPIFRDSMNNVPTLHIPMKKDLVSTALKNSGFKLATKKDSDVYIYKK